MMNETALVKIEEHRNEKVVCFTVDCVDPENEAWGQMSEWCKKNVPNACQKIHRSCAIRTPSSRRGTSKCV